MRDKRAMTGTVLYLYAQQFITFLLGEQGAELCLVAGLRIELSLGDYASYYH